MRIIEKMWIGYRDTIISKDAGELQIKETRQAFYSGATVLFTILTSQVFLDKDGDSIEPTDDDLLKMDAIQKEVAEFGAELDLAVIGLVRH